MLRPREERRMTGKPLKQRPMPFEGLRITGMNAVAFATTNVARVGHDHPFDVMAARAVDETLKHQAPRPGRWSCNRRSYGWPAPASHLASRAPRGSPGCPEHEDRGRACSQRGFGALAQVSASGDERRGLPGERFQIATRLPCLSNAWAMMVPMAPSPITDTSNSKLSSLCSRTLRGLLIIVLADVQQVSGLRFNRPKGDPGSYSPSAAATDSPKAWSRLRVGRSECSAVASA